MSAGTAELWCRRCERAYPAELYYCPVHTGEELVPPPAGRETPPPQDGPAPRAVCWRCGEASPNATNRTCLGCHESLVPPVLVVEFPDGAVVLRAPARSVELGRAGEYGHVFARYPNVSRRHATVGVDADGHPWLEPDPAAPNGTWVNGEEIVRRTPVRPGDEIRFATDQPPHVGPISLRVRQPDREPVSGPSENGTGTSDADGG